MKNTNQNKTEKNKSKVITPVSRLTMLGSSVEINDILDALKTDHDALRKLGAILKSETATDAEKKEAYMNFSTLLKSHSKAEEKAVYERCLAIEELTQEADEGFVEHQIADTLMKNIACTHDTDKWSAMVKVLAEIVENHADEEESQLIPDLQESFKKTDQAVMSREFVSLREQSQKNITDENAGILSMLQANPPHSQV